MTLKKIDSDDKIFTTYNHLYSYVDAVFGGHFGPDGCA